MNILFVFLLIFFLEEIQEKSANYYDCINPNRKVFSSTECTSILIPESDGYKCCSMEIAFENKSYYNCFALEIKYIQNKEDLLKYTNKRALSYLFGIVGGYISINCGANFTVEKIYPKYSDSLLNCYNINIEGVINMNDCIENDIPEKEKSKCCYLETNKFYGEYFIKDKKCLVIDDKYFTKEKKFNDLLLDQLKEENLSRNNITNIFLNCKNYDKCYFQGNMIKNNISKNKNNIDYDTIFEISSSKKDFGIKPWKMVIVIISSFIFFSIIPTLIIFLRKKRKYNSVQINI